MAYISFIPHRSFGLFALFFPSILENMYMHIRMYSNKHTRTTTYSLEFEYKWHPVTCFFISECLGDLSMSLVFGSTSSLKKKKKKKEGICGKINIT